MTESTGLNVRDAILKKRIIDNSGEHVYLVSTVYDHETKQQQETFYQLRIGPMLIKTTGLTVATLILERNSRSPT